MSWKLLGARDRCKAASGVGEAGNKTAVKCAPCVPSTLRTLSHLVLVKHYDGGTHIHVLQTRQSSPEVTELFSMSESVSLSDSETWAPSPRALAP